MLLYFYSCLSKTSMHVHVYVCVHVHVYVCKSTLLICDPVNISVRHHHASELAFEHLQAYPAHEYTDGETEW